MSNLRKWVGRSAVAVAAMAPLTAVASPAFAITNHSDHAGAVVAAAGSDSTEEFMSRYLSGAGDHNIPSQPTASYGVPGDAACGARTYTGARPVPAGQTAAPGGSTSGLAALLAEPGCIDIARSAQGPRPDEASDLNFWAYGLDYITWSTASPFAPPGLTIQQLREIYRCAPAADNWAEVGGLNAPITPFLPPADSAVADFFGRVVLGPTVTIGSCVKRTARPNSGRDMALTGSDHPHAIVPYATSNWIFQDINKANASLDVRNGFRLGGLQNVCGKAAVTSGAVYNGAARRWLPNTPALSSTGIISETNAFTALTQNSSGCGVTFVANVTRVGAPQQALAEQHIGAGSELCTGAAASQLSGAGIVALPAGPGIPNGVGVGTCRLYAT